MKVIIILFLMFFSLQAIADDRKIFVGYDHENKERYITWPGLAETMTNLEFGENGAKQISKYASGCRNDRFWYKAQMLKASEKHDINTFKFQFHWIANSKILYVDVDGATMSCREG